MKTAWCGVMAWALVLAAAAGADDKLVEEINPTGAWPKYEVGQPRRFHVWRNKDGWHVRTTSKAGQKVNFTGTIKVVGGNMTTIGGFGGLEKGKAKKPNDGDWGTWNKEKIQLQFRFSTNGKEDGFDFDVSTEAEAVEFTLKVDGFFHPKEVFIGKQGQHPKSETFRLPAHPSKK